MLGNLSIKRITTKIILYSYRNYVKSGGTPGLNKHIKKLKLDLSDFDDPEGIADAESDFMNVHKSHKQYTREVQEHREKINLMIVKNKYFKEKKPNFLTWSEKEQIRFLHSQEPEEWTPEVLSERFPADFKTIEKILKAKWSPKTRERIEKHDSNVFKNWNDFREDRLSNLDKELKEHLKKFAGRSMEHLTKVDNNWELKPELPKPKVNIFSNIISSCKKYQNETKQIEAPSGKTIVDVESFKLPNQNNEDTFVLDEITDKKPMRFQDMRNEGKIETNPDAEVDKPTTQVEDSLKIEKFDSDVVEIKENSLSLQNKNSFPDKIVIPRKLRKQGATYKMGDCFYDYDGEFLYRVPGMTGRKC